MDRWISWDSKWTMTLLHPVSSPNQPVLCISYESGSWATRYHIWLLINCRQKVWPFLFICVKLTVGVVGFQPGL